MNYSTTTFRIWNYIRMTYSSISEDELDELVAHDN